MAALTFLDLEPSPPQGFSFERWAVTQVFQLGDGSDYNTDSGESKGILQTTSVGNVGRCLLQGFEQLFLCDWAHMAQLSDLTLLFHIGLI